MVIDPAIYSHTLGSRESDLLARFEDHDDIGLCWQGSQPWSIDMETG